VYAPGQVDHVFDPPRAGLRQTKIAQGRIHTRQEVQRDESEQQVLPDGDAHQTVAGGGRDPGEAAQLDAGEVALVHAHGHRGVAGLLLMLHVGLDPRVVFRLARGDRRPARQQRAIAQRLGLRLVAAEASGSRAGQAMPPLARMSAYSISMCSLSHSMPRSRRTNFRRALFLLARSPY